jgi:hypothetical protein
MRKRLLLIGVAASAIMLGLAGFAANTAQWVNVTAHVEKEIEMACVAGAQQAANDPYDIGGYLVDPQGCAFGTVFPQDTVYKKIEVTLARSFFDQDRYSAVEFDVYWECKLVFEDQLAEPDPTDPGYNPCRNDPGYDPADFTPPGPPALTGNIRDYIAVAASSSGCLDTTGAADLDGDAELYFQGSGEVDNASVQKCFYDLTFKVPYCAGHANPNTDVGIDDFDSVDCVWANSTSTDPQDWEHYADLGDTFKVQVTNWVEAPIE